MKNLKVFVSLVSLFVITTNLKAQAVNAANYEDNFSVKYTGVQNNYLCFQVEIKGINNAIIFQISDKSEGELYSQNWKVKSPFQFFKIEKKDGQQLIFNLHIGKKEIIKTFTASTKMIEDTIVQENGLVIL